MKHLAPPTDENGTPFSAGNVFEICISMVRDNDLKSQLQSIRTDVEREADDYNAKAAVGELFLKTPHIKVKKISGEMLVKVYSFRMVPKKSRGRFVYDKIMIAAEHRKCPMCGIGTVKTLDHYLPKTHFPVFAVTPNNLVPCCQWCQGEKSEYFPTKDEDQLLHPYFDNVEDTIWLSAEVEVGTPPSFRYFAAPPQEWPTAMKGRVATHLQKLGLPFLFSVNAASRLSEIRVRLSGLHQKGGAEAVREHLREELDSISSVHINSWLAAMYRACISNDWFCDGGFWENNE